MARRQGGTLGGFTPLSTPNAPTDLSVSTSIGSASVSFTAPTDTGDAAVTSFIVTAIDEGTGVSTGVTASSSPITLTPGIGTFKIRAQAVNAFGPGRLTEFNTGNTISFLGAELYTWGYGGFGRLGHNSTASLSSPTQVGALTNWSQVSAGSSHTACVKANGTLFTWGYNQNKGTLGLSDTVNRSSPTQVGALSNWAQVSAGDGNTACVKTDGTLWTWGYNSNGQLGHNDVVNKSSPVQVGGLTNWAQVSTRAHTLCVKTDGTLWAWGIASTGQLGQNDINKRSSPTQVGALTNWAQPSAGNGFSACVKTDGTLFTWGVYYSGKLGHGDKINKSSPVQVGALTNWAQVAAGDSHTACVKTDGTLFTWGQNNIGQLGHNNNVWRSSPVQVGALTNWAQVALGDKATACTTTANTLFTWGDNSALFINLGHNDTILRSSPVQVGALTSWVQVSCTQSHMAAISGVI